MKKNIILIGVFFTLMLGLIMFTGCAINNVTGCAEGKSVVTKGDSSHIKQSANIKKTTGKGKAGAGAGRAEEAAVAAAAESIVRDIHFDFDKSNIRPDAREILKVNADYFLKHQASSIVVEGHCDERGTAEYNMVLGERRAKQAKKGLVNLGVKKSTIKTISYGKERPLDTRSNEEAWAKNRRAHFVVKPE